MSDEPSVLPYTILRLILGGMLLMAPVGAASIDLADNPAILEPLDRLDAVTDRVPETQKARDVAADLCQSAKNRADERVAEAMDKYGVGSPSIAVPSMPGMPNGTVPGMPALPGAPGVPGVPGMPALPGMPSNMSFPGMPSMPGLDDLPEPRRAPSTEAYDDACDNVRSGNPFDGSANTPDTPSDAKAAYFMLRDGVDQVRDGVEPVVEQVEEQTGPLPLRDELRADEAFTQVDLVMMQVFDALPW